MIRQVITYLIQWGRNGSGQWIYHETKITQADPAWSLAYPLYYWGVYFNNISWQNLAQTTHVAGTNLTSQNSLSFYGYEEIQWPEQFKMFAN
jgi:hypothetical protein